MTGLMLILLLQSSASAGVTEEHLCEQQRQVLLAEGRHLILEVNCNDCYQKTPQGLRQGIQKIEQALALGVTERGEACWLVHRAYWDLSFLGRGERDQEALGRSREALVCAIKEEPENPEWLYEFAMSFAHGKERKDLCLRVLAIAPDHPGALFTLGEIEVKEGETEKGTQTMLRAFWLADGVEAVSMGERLLGLKLEDLGLEAERILIENRVEDLRRESF